MGSEQQLAPNAAGHHHLISLDLLTALQADPP